MSAVEGLGPVYRWIRLERHCEITGDTRDAVYARRKKHQWVEGIHSKLGADGKIYVNPEEWNKWVQNQ